MSAASLCLSVALGENCCACAIGIVVVQSRCQANFIGFSAIRCVMYMQVLASTLECMIGRIDPQVRPGSPALLLLAVQCETLAMI